MLTVYKFIIHFCLPIIATLIIGSCSSPVKDKSQHVTSEPIAQLEIFCDSIDYNDTLLLHDRDAMEQVVTNIVSLMPSTDSISTDKALKKFFTNISRDTLALETAFEIAGIYLNDPASHVRNEDLFIRLLNVMSEINGIPEHIRLRTDDLLRIASLNRPGNIATDINFLNRDGRLQSLSLIDAKTILLIFYDPECPHCNDILNNIRTNPKINDAISNNLLTVVAIYAEGKPDVWERANDNMPQNWIVGYDKTDILENGLYDLPAMPVLYLLDSDKRVLLKDMPIERILY